MILRIKGMSFAPIKSRNSPAQNVDLMVSYPLFFKACHLGLI